eukprot:359108-Chlamydomonas_euryale.AAC.1
MGGGAAQRLECAGVQPAARRRVDAPVGGRRRQRQQLDDGIWARRQQRLRPRARPAVGCRGGGRVARRADAVAHARVVAHADVIAGNRAGFG